MSANNSLPSEGPADVVTATEARVAHAEEMTKKSSSLGISHLGRQNEGSVVIAVTKEKLSSEVARNISQLLSFQRFDELYISPL